MTVRLKQLGVIDPVVYCPHEGPLREAYEERGIRVEVFAHPLAGIHDPHAYDRAIENFAGRIEDLGVEVIYGNTRQTFYAIEAAKRMGLPSIWNLRESEDWRTYYNYLGEGIAARALQCFAYPYRVIFVSDATRESCLALNSHHNFITIHNGIDRERFAAALANQPRISARERLGISQGELAVLILGTICERKGQIELIEAVARMDERQSSRIKCFIVGSQVHEYTERLKSAVQALPISKRSRIVIAPETSDAALYYSAADLFVCSSRIESFPRVILEAMAAGLPIITTPVYGIAEQVRENINALFYQPGDAAGLAERIERFVKEPRLRREFAENSRKVLDTLTDFEGMAYAYARAFREAWLSGRSR
jgi:glycosyltransferase involved in cell wall biosynthesis